MRGHAEEAIYSPQPGWRFTINRHAAHECGWSLTLPASETGRWRAACEKHEAECPWPGTPELEADTPEG